MKKKIIVGNLKMNMENASQRDAYCQELFQEISTLKTQHDVIICPPIIYMEYFHRIFKKSILSVGTQDCFWELYGSYTGNTSPRSIYTLGGRYVIIGHSERREYNNETDEIVAKKVKMAVRVGLTPIVCVGFLSNGDEISSVQKQVESLIDALAWEELEKTVIAYEPVWAIGSGKTPTNDDIHTMIMYIRSMIANAHNKEKAEDLPILYGGSVSAQNVMDICVKSYADGVLVGTASLSPVNFVRIARMLNS
jgi:triosephosphate isomerase (TIM)